MIYTWKIIPLPYPKLMNTNWRSLLTMSRFYCCFQPTQDGPKNKKPWPPNWIKSFLVVLLWNLQVVKTPSWHGQKQQRRSKWVNFTTEPIQMILTDYLLTITAKKGMVGNWILKDTATPSDDFDLTTHISALRKWFKLLTLLWLTLNKRVMGVLVPLTLLVIGSELYLQNCLMHIFMKSADN